MEIMLQQLHHSQELGQVIDLYHNHPPEAAAFDTETDGLDIISSRPFIFQFGWYSPSNDTIYAFAIDLTAVPDHRHMIQRWHELVKSCDHYLAHNVKFDLHMLANIGCYYMESNLSDTQFYIRFAHDNIAPRNGGVLLGLKTYCQKYIDPSAKDHDSAIQRERTNIAKRYNQDLKKQLGWTLKKVDDFFKDKTNTMADLPTAQDYLNYMLWFNSLPEELKKVTVGRVESSDIPYTMVRRALVVHYALLDIVWVLKVYLQTKPVIEARDTMSGLELENDSIKPLWNMERMGLEIDTAYVERAYHRMRDYIRQRRQDLKDLAGMDITASQNAVILQYLRDQGMDINGTGDDILARVHRDYPDHPALPMIDCIRELRTLEKWFVTYLMRFKDKTHVYSTINQVGAATLRMSSDFQQFPKKGLKDKDGNELFNPRRMVKKPTGYDSIIYIDYSQIELRVQALYTILVGEPDTNLCRAYMPYQCIADGVEYDYTKPETRALWNKLDWRLKENPEQHWVPTDVHGATTMAAFDIDENHPSYKELRSLGKRVNFAKNYGAQRTKIAEMFPEYPADTITAIDAGYYKAFPGVKKYQSYCYDLVRYQQYATNLFGIKYWNVSGHNLINMLIQGGSATFLKWKIIEVANYIEANCPDVKMIIPIHDEIQFAFKDKDLEHVHKIQAIMEDWKDSYVPIVADIEITRTYWSEKEDYE